MSETMRAQSSSAITDKYNVSELKERHQSAKKKLIQNSKSERLFISNTLRYDSFVQDYVRLCPQISQTSGICNNQSSAFACWQCFHLLAFFRGIRLGEKTHGKPECEKA